MLVRPRAFDNFSANQCHCLVFRRWGDMTVEGGGGGDQGGGAGAGGGGIALLVYYMCAYCFDAWICQCHGAVCSNNDNNNILYSSLREIKAVVRSHNEEHISIILSH